MPYYLHQVAYTSESWAVLTRKPQNRLEAIRPFFEKLGGKVENAWFSFGEYDVVVLSRFPDNVDAAALSMAVAAGGSCKSVNTTPLLTAEEAMKAMKRAAKAGYKPVSKG